MNLKANKMSHREELVNILDIFKNRKSVQRIKLANFHSYTTLNFSKVGEILKLFHCLENGIFPDDLKFADVSPIFKKEDSFKKENYRPVSIIPHVKSL